ncbi:MAG: endonuclease [Clostridia bacterium]|nr:endonuclease [Clostridia bacterium]
MQKVLKSILSLGLATAVCVGATTLCGATEFALADAATDYYSAITAESGTQLLGQLHDLITSSRTKYSSYADCKNYGTTTDPGSASNTVMEFYTQTDIKVDNWNVSGGWNREHVWPKSDSNGLWKSDTVGGGADLHHIRPAEKDLNEHRGNKLYGEVNNGKAEYTSVSHVLGGHSTGSNSSGTFEPLDSVKGDIARILMYVYTHYNTYTNAIFGGNATTNGEKVSGFQSMYFGTLNYTHIITANSESNAIKLLLRWNEADPVDSIETKRNEIICGIQGNRNPFIDHPEYAEAIWGNGAVTPPIGDDEPSANVKAFRSAVAAIDNEESLSVRLASINTAVVKYGKLSDEDKVVTSDDIEKLRSAIASYNETIGALNGEADSADKTALKSAVAFH